MKGRRRVISAVLLALLLSAGACGGAAEIRGNSSADRLSEETENGSRDETDGFESTGRKSFELFLGSGKFLVRSFFGGFS